MSCFIPKGTNCIAIKEDGKSKPFVTTTDLSFTIDDLIASPHSCYLMGYNPYFNEVRRISLIGNKVYQKEVDGKKFAIAIPFDLLASKKERLNELRFDYCFTIDNASEDRVKQIVDEMRILERELGFKPYRITGSV